MLGESGGNVGRTECLNALHAAGGNVVSALKQLKLEQLLRYFYFLFCLQYIYVHKIFDLFLVSRLGVASKEQCESALQATDWNVELAASSILDSR